ncbi:hypothetical protein BKA56DRAFT_226676 [Ilyonectria sp. MPI-CAGE-AT-0026]|nr:hypothetical protein BKA56DRAFT_226676 [Ilyonectria sp. MPI-CAGE-AT-0026]
MSWQGPRRENYAVNKPPPCPPAWILECGFTPGPPQTPRMLTSTTPENNNNKTTLAIIDIPLHLPFLSQSCRLTHSAVSNCGAGDPSHASTSPSSHHLPGLPCVMSSPVRVSVVIAVIGTWKAAHAIYNLGPGALFIACK